MAKVKELLDDVDTKAYDAGSPSPRSKSGVSAKDMLDSLPKRVDNSVVHSGDEKTRPAKKG